MSESTPAFAVLMRSVIDYAGLFPPSAHNMAESVERYARYRLGADALALGRFVVPAARLMEWEQAVAALPPAMRGSEPWRLSALIALPAARQLTAVGAFNERGASGHDVEASVDSIEVKVTSEDEVRQVAADLPAGVEAFYECAGPGIPADAPRRGRDTGGGAKIRTGGLVPSAIPAPDAVAAFVAGCVARSLPFKATAGLHHPLRAPHALTYEPDSPRAVMHGFLNVFIAALLADACRLEAAALLPILEETSLDAFEITGTQIGWRHLAAGADQVAAARRIARSFGSCSFEEPVADLKTLGLTP